MQQKTYTPTIGLEVHAELKTKTKMFCGSKNEPHRGEPNTHVCPICMGHPGTLPVINREAVYHVLKVGRALNGKLATYTEFDRKNYFYPDIPKGYQISQYAYPLVEGGELCGIQITRVHLEEDTARSLHDQGEGSIIDFNRAGVPLMELVTEPVIHDAKTAGNFARELQLLLRTIGAGDAHMEKGEMRVEANISVSDTDAFGTKVEIKNLNSFRSVEAAIEYEIRRQSEILDRGEKVVQETRGWDESKGKTFSQRIKETAHDYRYFPDPDIPSLRIDSDLVSRLNEEMPVLPSFKRERYRDIGLTREQSEIIISDSAMDKFFSLVLESVSDDFDILRLSANYLVTDATQVLAEHKAHPNGVRAFVRLMQMLLTGEISSRVGKDLLLACIRHGIDVDAVINEQGLRQVDSDEAIVLIAQQIIEENPRVVDELRSGKDSALQFLIGQGMKLSRGSANPKKLSEVLRREIGL